MKFPSAEGLDPKYLFYCLYLGTQNNENDLSIEKEPQITHKIDVITKTTEIEPLQPKKQIKEIPPLPPTKKRKRISKNVEIKCKKNSKKESDEKEVLLNQKKGRVTFIIENDRIIEYESQRFTKGCDDLKNFVGVFRIKQNKGKNKKIKLLNN